MADRAEIEAHPTPEQTRAMEYVAAAEREAAIIPDIPASTTTRKIGKAAIIGAGTMGGGIAMSLANIGIPVTLLDASQEALDRGIDRVRHNYATTVSRGRLDQATMDKRMGLFKGALDYSALADADLIIEAVFEEISLKQEIFKKLDAIAKPGAILATNTSGLDIDQIAAVTKRPEDVIGAHFFSPANVQRLLEVVRASKTAKDVIATVMKLGRDMGKVSVLARIYDGFIGNALLRHYSREAHFLLEEGATPQQVDKALTDFGFAMGIFAVHDLAGNDVGYHTRKKQMATRPNDRRYSDLILMLCEMGRLGRRLARAGIVMTRAAAHRSPIPWSRSSSCRNQNVTASSENRSPMKILSNAASTAWSTRARVFWRRASPSGRAISIYVTSPVTASRNGAAAQCIMPIWLVLEMSTKTSNVSTPSMVIGGNRHRY